MNGDFGEVSRVVRERCEGEVEVPHRKTDRSQGGTHMRGVPEPGEGGGCILLAFLLLVPIFTLRSIAGVDFWWLFSSAVLLLTLGAARSDRTLLPRLRQDLSKDIPVKFLVAILSATLLYFVFWTGHILSTSLFSFAQGNIQSVYAMRGDASLLRVILLISLVIGPAEEVFWRGFVQERLSRRFGPLPAVLTASFLYSLVHLGSLNPMLLMAALVCGIFWGLLYTWKRSLLVNCISHVLWDLAVFIAFPYV